MACLLPPIRWLISLSLCSIAVVTYLTRNNVNNAIVDMVLPSNSSTQRPDLCPASIVDSVESPGDKVHLHDLHAWAADEKEESGGTPRFPWTPQLQGLVLGSFFWPYFLCQVPSGYLAGRFGGWIPICVSLTASGIISLMIPVITTPSAVYLITARALMGVFQSAIFPGIFVTACNWAPIEERSLFIAVNEIGAQVGNILMQFCSGYLMHAYSWSILFYLPGSASLVLMLFVLLFVRNHPEDHCLVTPDEVACIHAAPRASTDESTILVSADGCFDEETVRSAPSTPSERIPWSGILSNRAVWALFLFKFARSLASYLLSSELPTYLASVLHEDLVTIGVVTAVGTSLTLVSLVASAKVSEVLIQRRCFTRTKARKLFALLSGLGNALFLVLIPSLRCNHASVITVFFIDSFLYGCQTGSDTPLPAEMTSKFYAVVYAMTNLFATAPGFLAPMITGAILTRVQDRWLAWSLVFYSFGGFLALASLFFLAFASAARQDFDLSPSERQQQQRLRYQSALCAR